MLKRELIFYENLSKKLTNIKSDNCSPSVFRLESALPLSDFINYLKNWPQERERERERERELEPIFSIIDRFSFYLDSSGSPEKIWSDFMISCISCYNDLTPQVFLYDEKILFYFVSRDHQLPVALRYLKDNFTFFKNCDFLLIPYSQLELGELIGSRIKHWKAIFDIDGINYLDFLYKKFEDDISRYSFGTYMKQRLHGWMAASYPVIYPVKPPKETSEWRMKRRQLVYDLPILEGCSESSKSFFYDANWKMQQYAIPGECEAVHGDIVIDAGAFIGDTALYFAQIVGPSGKVYAFEPINENIDILRNNIMINTMSDIITIIPKAISDRSERLKFTNRGSDSTAIESEDKTQYDDEFQEVDAISLDDFVETNNIKRVNFLKADLQGFDVAFIKGGMKTIKNFAPKCGLTVYHKELDIVLLPQLLLTAQPKYRFWFRCESEPVLYAAL